MSKCRYLDGLWCYQCKYYKAIIYDLIGTCECNDSTHCEHVISETHVACKHFEAKK